MTRKRASKRKPQRRQRKANVSTALASHVSTEHRQLCGISNPFCAEAVGSKVPDSDGSKSVAVTLKYYKTATTSAGGRVAMQFSPGLTRSSNLSNDVDTTPGTVVSWVGWQQHPEYASMANSFESYRVVSWGVRIWNHLPPLSKSGRIRIITIPEEAPPNYVWDGSLYEEVVDIPATEPYIYWISKPMGVDHLSYEFVNTNPPYRWDSIIVVYDGGPASTNALSFEVVAHYECQVNIGSVSALMATPAASSKPHLLAARNEVHNKHAGTHLGRSLGSAIANTAKQVLLDGVSMLVPFAGRFLRGVLGGHSTAMVPYGGYVPEVD